MSITKKQVQAEVKALKEKGKLNRHDKKNLEAFEAYLTGEVGK